MQLALEQARLAAAEGEVPVGAVVVKDGQLVSTGRNAPIGGQDPTAHAEVQALRAAAQTLGNYRLDGCTLYVTLEPCAMCSGAMLHARLSRVVFGAPDAKTGAAGGLLNLFAQPGLNHQTGVTGGVLATDCAALLQAFFRPRRLNARPLREDALRTPPSRFDGLDDPSLRGFHVQVSQLPALAGLNMHVLDTGPVPGPTVMVLHGPWGWGWEAEALVTELMHLGVRAVVPDLPGFGRSDKPKKPGIHTLAWHTQCLEELGAHLGLVRAAVLVPQVPQTVALAVALCQAAPGHFERVVAWSPAAAEGNACPGLDAPFPDGGHRAAQRALALWDVSAGISQGSPNAFPFHHISGMGGQLGGCAGPVWAQWSGGYAVGEIKACSDCPDNRVFNDAALARHLVALVHHREVDS